MSTEVPAILRSKSWRHVATARFVRIDGAAVFQRADGRWSYSLPPHANTRPGSFTDAGRCAQALNKHYPLQPEKNNG